MNVSKQELDALTRAVLTDVSWAYDRAKTAMFLNSKDQMNIAGDAVTRLLLRVIDFRDKHQLPAILADEPYRKERQSFRQKKIEELSKRLAANQQDIERMQQHSNSLQAELDKLQKETT